MSKKIFLLFIFFTLFVFTKSVLGYQGVLKPNGYVNDFASMVSPEARASIEEKLTLFKNETGNEITLVTIEDLQGEDIQPFATRLFREWGLGEKERNNGILFLISKNDKKMRIEVGYGLEGALPDITAGSIIRNEVTPLFKEGKFDQGIIQGIDSIILATKNEYIRPVEKKINGNLFPFFMFIFIFGWQILVAILAPTKSWWLGGVIGGTIGAVVGAVMSSLLWGGLATAGFGLLGLFIDYVVSKKYKKGSHPVDSFFSGGTSGWGSGGGSSGGFGGFSGGSSGGGGASGSW